MEKMTNVGRGTAQLGTTGGVGHVSVGIGCRHTGLCGSWHMAKSPNALASYMSVAISDAVTIVILE